MADTTEIAWCDSTFNPWEGCQKVGPGCDHCYAEARNARFGGGKAPNWGPGAPRRRTSQANWRKPLQWNAESFVRCDACGWRGPLTAAGFSGACPGCSTVDRYTLVRRRVFCSSLADVFDNEVPKEWRRDLFRLILETPNLDWQLLTKRIGNARGMLPWTSTGAWPNVWLGATVVNQEEADRDIPKLLATPARVRFLSMEPLLGLVNLLPAFMPPEIDWVIVGGESGAGARPMHPDWARSLRDQCAAAGVPFLFKQWGEWSPGYAEHGNDLGYDAIVKAKQHEWPEGHCAFHVGKKAAGRLLDGVEHNGFPEVRCAT